MLGLVAVAAMLAVPTSGAVAGGGPVATKSGTLVSYVSGPKIKIRKKIQILAVCTAACDVQSTLIVKGPRFFDTDNQSGSFGAGVSFGPFIKPNGPLLRSMKATPGKFKLQNTLTATDPATGQVDQISGTFRLKR